MTLQSRLKISLTVFTLTMLLLYCGYSQERGRMLGGSISGTVVDSVSGKAMEYANVILFHSDDSSLVSGIATGNDGRFELARIRPGRYYVDINFIGFEKRRINDISVERGKFSNDLGKILLHPASINLDKVIVEGERSPVSYQLDKKVIDVSQMQTVVSGNAADVLQNVPSVTVDIEGNVSLRGSSNFTVLVDGRPSILEAQDVLQQTPATSIQTIEIVTNPSAKYSAEGESGIINIILKKTDDIGLTGVTNLNGGLHDKYGGDFLFEYKNDIFNSNFGANYNRRFSPGNDRKEEVYTIGGNTSTINSNGNSNWGRIFSGVRGGIEFRLGEADQLSFGGRYGSREMGRTSSLNFFEQSQIGNLQYINKSKRERSGDFYGINTNYNHKFENNGHEIKTELTYSKRTGDGLTLTESFNGNILLNGKRTTETDPSTEVEGKIDYTLPLGARSKFEAGFQGESDLSNESNGLNEFDSASNAYIYYPLFSHNTKFTENEQAVYSLYSNEWENFGIQGGIRGEYTFREIKLVDQNQTFTTDRWDFFPTLHASYKIQGGSQLMASYTRRIRRPGGWSLEPFLTWVDANNVQQGNPALKNQYIDSYETGVQTSFIGISLSTEAYYRITHNKIENIRSVYSDNVTLTTFENVGKDYSLGTEFQFNADPLKMWNVNLMGNIYQYKVEGMLYNQSFSRESFNWNARLNNSFKFSMSTQLQFNAMYNSSSVSSQGTREGFFTTDLALRHDLFERTVSLTLQVRDLFKTGKQEFTTRGAGYYSYNYSTGEAPMVMLSIKYLFNNYSDEERRGREDSGGSDEEGF